jgi:hypothetical protein
MFKKPHWISVAPITSLAIGLTTRPAVAQQTWQQHQQMLAWQHHQQMLAWHQYQQMLAWQRHQQTLARQQQVPTLKPRYVAKGTPSQTRALSTANNRGGVPSSLRTPRSQSPATYMSPKLPAIAGGSTRDRKLMSATPSQSPESWNENAKKSAPTFKGVRTANPFTGETTRKPPTVPNYPNGQRGLWYNPYGEGRDNNVYRPSPDGKSRYLTDPQSAARPFSKPLPDPQSAARPFSMPRTFLNPPPIRLTPGWPKGVTPPPMWPIARDALKYGATQAETAYKEGAKLSGLSPQTIILKGLFKSEVAQ